MCAVENSPVLFAIIIGLRPKTIGTKQAATTDGSPYLFSTTFFVFSSQRTIFSTCAFLQFSLVPCFQGWTLRLSVTRYFNPLFIYLFTSDSDFDSDLHLTSRSQQHQKKKHCEWPPSLDLFTTWNELAEPKPWANLPMNFHPKLSQLSPPAPLNFYTFIPSAGGLSSNFSSCF